MSFRPRPQLQSYRWWLIAIVVLFLIGLFWLSQSSQVESQTEYPSRNELFVRQRNTPPTDTRTLASLKYETLLECVAWHESRQDPTEVNEHDPRTPSIGYLQFKRKTWNYFDCEGSIWSKEDQMECANRAVSNSWSNLSIHWKGTYYRCLR